jgi:hypothetical protein
MDSPHSEQGFFPALASVAIAAPLLLVACAFEATPDSLERARFVLQGCELTVGLLATAIAMRLAAIGRLRSGTGSTSGDFLH